MAAPKKNTPHKSAQQKPLPQTISNKNYDNFIIAFILLVTAIAFSNSLANDFIINWDDDGYIISNPLIKQWSLNGLKTIFTVPHLDNYHPFTTLSNAIELHFFGLDPKPYHFFNLVLHLLNTFLVYRFVKLLSGRMEVAAITALFFGIHPMHVESVAWIAERKDVLYTFFFLGSLIYYLRYTRDSKPVYFTFSLLLFICSLLSKPAAVVLAPVLLLLDYYTGRKMDKKTILEKIPFFALSLFFGILAIHIQQLSGSTNLAPQFPAIDKIFLASYALAYYLAMLVAPFGLSALHLYPVNHTLSWEYYCAPVLLCIIVWGIYKAGKFRKDLLFGTLFFLINIVLVIQIIPVGRAIVGERYTYVPYIGLFFIIGKFYCWVLDGELSFSGKIKPYLQPVLIGYTLLLLLLTWNRSKDWKDSYTLFTQAIAANPGDYYGYFARSVGASLLGDDLHALPDLNDAIRLNPACADAFYSRGVIKEKTNPASAIADYTEAIRLKPAFDKAYYNRGNLRIQANDFTGSITDYDSALKYNPGYAEAYCNRGAAKANTGKLPGAIADYNEALRLSPELANAWYNLASAELTSGNPSLACDAWHKALQYGYTAAQKQIEEHCK